MPLKNFLLFPDLSVRRWVSLKVTLTTLQDTDHWLEVACAAAPGSGVPDSLTFGMKCWRLRKGEMIVISGTCVEKGDYSYIKKNGALQNCGMMTSLNPRLKKY